MTREKAIDFLKRMKCQADYVEMGDEEGDEALDIAIEALNQEDLVEGIRCEGCRYYADGHCDMHGMGVYPEDYCSYAVGR